MDAIKNMLNLSSKSKSKSQSQSQSHPVASDNVTPAISVDDVVISDVFISDVNEADNSNQERNSGDEVLSAIGNIVVVLLQ